MFWNSNGINGKRHNLKVMLKSHTPDLFALTETKLIPSITDGEVCDKYSLHRYDRTFGSGRGGVLIGISDSSNIKVT